MLAAIWFLAKPLALLILGISIDAVLEPLAGRLSRRMPRLLAVILIYFAVLLIIIGLGFAVIPTLASQAKGFRYRLPELINQGEQWLALSSLIGQGNLLNLVNAETQHLMTMFFALPVAFIASILEVLVVIVVSIYWMVFSPNIHRFFISLFPNTQHAQLESILEEMGSVMGGYIRGALINGVIIGTFAYIGLSIIGVNFPIVLSIMMGSFELLPVIGPIIGGAIIIGMALLQSTTLGIISLIFVIILQQSETHILAPNVFRSQTNIHPVLAILVIFTGGLLGGLLGAFVAVPLVSIALVLVRRLMIPAIRRQTGANKEADEA